jgi:hypothetical protein
MAAIYFVLYVTALIIVALPVFYFGEIDGASFLLLAGGLGLIVWAAFRIHSNRK